MARRVRPAASKFTEMKKTFDYSTEECESMPIDARLYYLAHAPLFCSSSR
jgi:hypothetical protein